MLSIFKIRGSIIFFVRRRSRWLLVGRAPVDYDDGNRPVVAFDCQLEIVIFRRGFLQGRIVGALRIEFIHRDVPSVAAARDLGAVKLA